MGRAKIQLSYSLAEHLLADVQGRRDRGLETGILVQILTALPKDALVVSVRRTEERSRSDLQVRHYELVVDHPAFKNEGAEIQANFIRHCYEQEPAPGGPGGLQQFVQFVGLDLRGAMNQPNAAVAEWANYQATPEQIERMLEHAVRVVEARLRAEGDADGRGYVDSGEQAPGRPVLGLRGEADERGGGPAGEAT